MADNLSPSPSTMEPKEPDNPNPNKESQQPDHVPSPSPASQTTSVPVVLPPPPAISSFPPLTMPVTPSFRPVQPQFTPFPSMQNLAFQNPGVQPPGVGGAIPVSNMMSYPVPPGQQPNPAMRPYMTMPNGYPGGVPMAAALSQGSLLSSGILRYPSPYAAMVRYPSPRPPGAMGMFPILPHPPFTGIPGIRPFMPLVRPAILPVVTPAEKPQTTVYIGKISPTVDNEFMLSILQLCGPVKSWKRAQDPKNGTPVGFGFYEFESAEGVLRALRLISKLNIDGQELMLNVNQATKGYLERYVAKKTENSKQPKETQVEETEKEESSIPSADKSESSKTSEGESKKDETADKESADTTNFGIVTDEDKDADSAALEKVASMIEERIKTRPLPPPPPPPPDQSASDGNSKSQLPLRDGNYDVDMMRNDTIDYKNDEDTTSENKQVNDHDKPETGSPIRSRRHRSRERSRDRERDLKREKDREFEKVEREAQRERERKERERDRKLQEAERTEREYKERVKEWESRERERERQRQAEKEREKERERKRKKEIKDDEFDDDESRKRLRRSTLEEKRRKRLQEQEDDLEDKLKEEEEIVEAQIRAKEEQERREKQQEEEALKLLSAATESNKSEVEVVEDTIVKSKDKVVEQAYKDGSGQANRIGNGIVQNGMDVDDSAMGSTSVSDMQQGINAPAKKMGFGLVGTGKKTSVPSVFTVEEDDGQNDKKMRPLVPIDYSKEELQAVQPSNAATAPPNLAAAAEFAKRISNANPKDEKHDGERERSRRSYDKSSHWDRDRDRDRSNDDVSRRRDDNRERNVDREKDRDRERGTDKLKTPDTKKLLDAKQLIDMIPKTKEELFSYEINWTVYDKHELHKRMRPWILKKITEFLGEEENTLVDYILSSTQEHVKASQMLELLQSILDDEAEMFVLKMWRMLIFEIKKVEASISSKSKA